LWARDGRTDGHTDERGAALNATPREGGTFHHFQYRVNKTYAMLVTDRQTDRQTEKYHKH